MPEAIVHKPTTEEIRVDRWLLASILICTFAGLANTIVGYTVAHWVCDVNRKTTGFIVSGVDFALCLIAGLLAFAAMRRLTEADDTQPETGRRRFMAKLGMVLAVFSLIVIIAGTLAMLTIQPCD